MVDHSSRFPTRRAIALGAVLTTALLAVAGVAVARPGADSDLSQTGGAARLHGDQSQAVRKAIDPGRARNVILLIGDGMGDSEITAARNYQYGAAGRFPGIDALPLTGQYTTYSLTKAGRKQLEAEEKTWDRTALAIRDILKNA